MGISRGQMQRQLYASGGIRSLVPREHYGLGSIFKKAARAVKKVVSSDVGKMALLAAGVHFMKPGFFPGMWESATGAMSGNWGKAAALGGLGLFAGKSVPKQAQFNNTARSGNISSYLRDYYTRMYPNKSEEEINELIETNTSEYAAHGGLIKGRTEFDEGGWGGDESWNEPDSHDFSEDIGSVGDTEPSHDFSTDIGTVGDTGYIPPTAQTDDSFITTQIKKTPSHVIKKGIANKLGLNSMFPVSLGWELLKGTLDKNKDKTSSLNNANLDNLVAGNYSQNAVSNQMFGMDFNSLNSFQQGQINDAINTYGTTSLGTIKLNQGGIINGRKKFEQGWDYESPSGESGLADIDDVYSAADAASYAGGQGMETLSEFIHGDPASIGKNNRSHISTPSHGGDIKNPLHPGYNPNDIYNHGITRLPNRGGMGPTPLIDAQTTEANTYLRQYYRNMYPNKTEEEIDELMEGNTQSAAEGGRMGYALGTNGNGWHQGDWTDPNDPDYEPKPQKLAENTDALQSLLKEFIEVHKRYPKDMEELKRWALKRMQGGTTEEESTSLAEILPEKQDGGRIGYALGPRDPGLQSAVGDIPTRQNEAGVTELDFRDNGGFVPPIGIKEKADDIPAMVSNNEFVFTADAVKAAGGGNVDKGAQRMYDLMKQLEGKIA